MKRSHFPQGAALACFLIAGVAVSAQVGKALPGAAADVKPPASLEPGVIWNPFRPAADNHPLTLRILVLNYDPIVPDDSHRRLSEVFKWNQPERLATRYRAAMEYATGGAIRYEIAEWRNLNEIYAQKDGYRCPIEEYVKNRRAGSGWHDGKGQDYPRLLREQGVAEMVSRGLVDEVWIFSDHFFGLWEASMAGPGAFNINGGVYPEVPSTRPFALYGFNYERGVAEMMHDAAHRTEATLNRVYGGWKLSAPVSNWDRFSANFAQSNGDAGVGTCHYPANAEHDYDYGNPREVESWADAFLTYPRLDFVKRKVSRATWSPDGGDAQLDYMKWYFAHIPRAPGTNPDGRANNWFKYIWNFENYDRQGASLPAAAKLIGKPLAAVGDPALPVAIGFSAAGHIDLASVSAKAIEALTPGGAPLAVALLGTIGQSSGPYRVAYFSVAPPGGIWKAEHTGACRLRLRGGIVRDLSGVTLPAGDIGVFQIVPKPSAADGPGALTLSVTQLLLAPGQVRRLMLTEKDAAPTAPDLTHAATWASADPAVLAVTGGGRFTGGRPGRTTLRAGHGGRSISIPVEVSATLPAAKLGEVTPPAAPSDPLVVKISFRGGSGLAADSLGFGDVLLLGPGGIFAFADAPTPPAAAQGDTTVTYSIPAPERGWPPGPTACALQLKAWQVRDTAGSYFPETDLGSLKIQPRR